MLPPRYYLRYSMLLIHIVAAHVGYLNGDFIFSAGDAHFRCKRLYVFR